MEKWPALPFDDWRDTCETLHLWTQIVGKVRLALSPHINHWWHIPLYVTARGLTTASTPYEEGLFEIQFDFIDHQLLILTSEGATATIPLSPRSVATFYREVMTSLHDLGIDVEINTLPNEIKNPIRFEEDEVHASYDPLYVERFWHLLVETDKVLKRYRSQFLGKSSLIHFFWGSFDLALTFFSGRRAPEREGADPITREAYSHEVISCGFWPGNASFPHPAFYSYTAPVPSGLERASIRPEVAFYSQEMGEFFLRYEDIRTTDTPAQMMLDFFQSTYEAGANLARWDRATLERGS
ncbi:DUF5996 family protein [Ktedonobacter racemifer]|uniref:Ava_C0101 and related proteins n=1 Tax=Ktedonobacter racemifer DSM 44963 TaxID=485913 RepID=D6TWG6_KTERA|nr:DUF5996 family protein [Ktedonobacter racemifer]EFH84549.1 conserved hypothetical protein [Ktedonobacter racemifer DSM 44963]